MINKQETLKVVLLTAKDKEAGKEDLIHLLIKIHDKEEPSKLIKMCRKDHVINKKEDLNLVQTNKTNNSLTKLADKK